jgi:hypothetical protein
MEAARRYKSQEESVQKKVKHLRCEIKQEVVHDMYFDQDL